MYVSYYCAWYNKTCWWHITWYILHVHSIVWNIYMLSCIAIKMFYDKTGTRIWSHFIDFHQFFVYMIEIKIHFSSFHIYVIYEIKVSWLKHYWNYLHFIAELAECSPIIIQNTSNPSSQKNLDVRPYDRTTVQGATALSGSLVVSALGSESGDPGFSPWDVQEKKKASSAFRLG